MQDRELLELAAKAGKRERHGMDRTPEHRAWVSMKQRCTNPNKRDYSQRTRDEHGRYRSEVA